ncbi:MAG: HAMP domain-containing sensor histidine kinase [Bacillota bacterium]
MIIGILLIPITIIILMAYQNINYSSLLKENIGKESQQTTGFLSKQINRDIIRYKTLINAIETNRNMVKEEYTALFPEIEDIAIIRNSQTTDYLNGKFIINMNKFAYLDTMLDGAELVLTGTGGKLLIKQQIENSHKSAIIILGDKYWERIIDSQSRQKVCIIANNGSLVFDSISQDTYLIDNNMFNSDDFKDFFNENILNNSGYTYYDTYGKYGRQLVVSYAPIKYPDSSSSIGSVVFFFETPKIIADKRISEIVLFITFFLAGTVLIRLIFKLSEIIISQFIKISEGYRNITQETEKIKKKLLISEKLASMGRVTSGITHEIGNPLSSILSMCQILESNKLSEDQRNDYIVRIKNDALRIDSLIKEFLYSSGGKMEVTMQLDINDLVNNALETIPKSRINPKIKLYKDLATNLPYSKGVQKNLEIALSNIILNSYQAIKDEGCIYIKTYRQKNYATISVKDTGSGISKKDIENIFDPFYSTKPIGEGYGVGLFICQQIIEAHGGIIKVISAIDEGTEIIIKLPFAENG